MREMYAAMRSNAEAKRELGWTLRYPTWRQGCLTAYARTTVRARTAPNLALQTRTLGANRKAAWPRSGSSLGLMAMSSARLAGLCG
jgi:hypothetical protein